MEGREPWPRLDTGCVLTASTWGEGYLTLTGRGEYVLLLLLRGGVHRGIAETQKLPLTLTLTLTHQ